MTLSKARQPTRSGLLTLRACVRTVIGAAWLAAFDCSAPAASLTIQTNILGPTPDIIAYNSGHFFPGGNTRDWWRYAGVNGGRLFISPGSIEATDDNNNPGDGVTNQSSFLSRKALLRSDPLNTNYINWAYFSNRYETVDLGALGGNNRLKVNFALTSLRSIGVKPLIQITAGLSTFNIASTNDWPEMWELWQHYYAQSFYLGRVFGVERYQMFNEPNHSNAGGITLTNFFLRLQLASDAIQCAQSDVNVFFGKSLVPQVYAPVTSGSAESSYTGGWGEMVVTNRHQHFFNGWDTNFLVCQIYDYHQYGSTPASFGSSLSSLHGLLSTAMAPGPRFSSSISEYNTRTGATFDTMTETLDTPSEYARFGSISINLMTNGLSELYAFKFSQTRNDGTYPVQKNAMHYVDNTNAPYNIGGITRAGEVYRLFNKAFAAGRTRLSVIKDAGAANLDVQAAAAGADLWLYIVNYNASSVALDLNLAAANVPAGGSVLIEEVSEACYGGVVLATNLGVSGVISGTMPAYSVWLLSTSTNWPQTSQTIYAADDAEVRDGPNKTANYGTAGSLTAQNDSIAAGNRAAGLMRFNLAGVVLSNLQAATPAVLASSASVSTTAQAHVYCTTNINWSQSSITWSTMPGLRQGVAAGFFITNSVINGVDTNTFIAGQFVTTSSVPREKRIDVTTLLRNLAATDLTFLVVQDPRWNTTLPTLESGDSQPDGVKIISQEGGSAPRLELVFSSPALPNSIPQATNDVYSATEDMLLIVAAPGVLANDHDPDANPLSSLLVSPPAMGVLNLSVNGGFTYLPATNHFGTDSFIYVATDGQTNSAPVAVQITVSPVNDPPVAAADTASTARNQAVLINVLANDNDVDGDYLSVSGFSTPANGSVVNNGDGTLTYSPRLNFTGADSFMYTNSDAHGGIGTAVVNIAVTAPPVEAFQTNLPVKTEAYVRGGVNAALNQDEAAQGYLFVKYTSPLLDSARKAYFQFDVSGLKLNTSTSATFAVTLHTNTYLHRAQLWGLNQSYPGFNDAITWNAAQANETNSNDLITNGTFTATRIGLPYLFPASPSTVHSFVITNLADFLFSNRVTLVLAGVSDTVNDAGGLRIARANAVLQVSATASNGVSIPVQITSIRPEGVAGIRMDFSGAPFTAYLLQASTSLYPAGWLTIGTNFSDSAGFWTATNQDRSVYGQRFYRVYAP